MNELEWTKATLKIRTEWGMEDQQRDHGVKDPECAEILYDIPYGNDPHWQIMDICRPKDKKGLYPVIVSVHGGGWVYSHKEYYHYYCTSLTKYGYACVNFNYRLAPECPYPASIEDINSLFLWLQDHAAEYSLDLDRLYAVGDSAGAQMLSQYMTYLTNPAYKAPFPLPQNIKIKAAGLNCGAYDMSDPNLYDENNENYALIAAYFNDAAPGRHAKEISILPYITSEYPPCYIMTASYDFLKENAEPFYNYLKKRGVECEYHLYGDENTPELIHVFHCDMKLPMADVCNRDECRFFSEHI